jgi:hypothetical protein
MLDRHLRITALPLIAATVLGGLPPASALAAAAPRIGIAAEIQNQVSAIQGTATRSLGLGNDVFAGDRIHTGQSSNAQLTFLDQTNLTIGSQSDVVLDKFVFDPAKGAGNVLLSTTQGALRFVSGAQDPNTYKINTPVATIAIRGTLAYSFIFGGTEYVVNGYGHVTATLNAPGSQTIVIPPGEALVILPPSPGNPNGKSFLIKWELGLLDVDRLAQLLPQFPDKPDGFADLIDQHNDAGLPPLECDCG